MKLLYLPNESELGDQYGPRHALEKAKEDGLLKELSVFSYRVENRKNENWNRTLNSLLGLIKEKLPTSILMQHTTNYGFPESFWRKVFGFYKGILPILAYDERDTYGYITKRLPKEMKDMVKRCDIVFLIASGKFAQMFYRLGCQNVCYLPNPTTLACFGKKWVPTAHREYDIVMIGNNSKRKIPFLRMPGSKQRENLARKLAQNFGPRFGLFGNGWNDNPSNCGPVDFLKQEETLRRSWIGIGHDHFHRYEMNFSNSLPISLISGIPYVLRRVPGIENLLVDGYHCRMYSHIDEAVDICHELLNAPQSDLKAMGMRGYEIVKNVLIEEVRMKKLLMKLNFLESRI